MKKLIFIALMLASLTSFSQVETIRVLSIDRYQSQGYCVIRAGFRIAIPNPLGSSAQCDRIVMSYANKYNISRIDSIAGKKYVYIVQEESITPTTTKTQIRTTLVNRFNDLTSKIAIFVANLEVFDFTIGESYIDNIWQLSPQINSL
jgi:hypothetical protein